VTRRLYPLLSARDRKERIRWRERKRKVSPCGRVFLDGAMRVFYTETDAAVLMVKLKDGRKPKPKPPSPPV
jgi:hypothetical protein